MKSVKAPFKMLKHGICTSSFATCLALSLSLASQSGADTLYSNPKGPSINLFGATGLIDMPSAEHQERDQITATVSHFGGPAKTTRATLTFQITDRLSGSFRYSVIKNFNATGRDTRYDRSFDLRYRLLNEGRYLPAVTIGLQDFAGTGVYSAEYIVATKNLHPTLKVTAGLGWGRLGGVKGTNQRQTNIGNGGVPDAGNWFRGPVKPFGGIEWQTPIRNLTFKAEYSSDSYGIEVARAGFDRRTDINIGLEYRPSARTQYGLYYLHGSYLTFQAAISFNPKRPPAPSGLENATPPVFARPKLQANQRFDTAWVTAPGVNAQVRTGLKAQLEPTKLTLDGLQLDPSGKIATLYMRNTIYQASAEAVGRAARAMSRAVPASVDQFRIITVSGGLPVSQVTLNRQDLEDLEYAPDGSAQLLARTEISDAPARAPQGLEYEEGRYSGLRWSIAPYTRTSFFDPDAPLRLDVGIRAKASYYFTPGLSVTGSVIKPLAGNLDKITRGANPRRGVPQVRSRAADYFRQGDPAIERLSADYVFKLSPSLYGRLSAGLLETMYGGVSAEVLWKPANSRLALGAEVNYVRQREFEQRFGFRNYEVLTGHVSAYYQFDNGFTGQIDAGRYLAGDLGATFTLNRQFNNGWKVGAFFTLTDMSFEDFGEGSFDKGIHLTIPLTWVVGNASKRSFKTTIRPLTRDGGARLNVQNRLYESITAADGIALRNTWGRALR